MPLAAAGAAAGGAAAAAPAAVAAAGASLTPPAPGASTAAVAAAATRHGLAKKQPEQQAEIEKLQKTIVSLSQAATQRQQGLDNKQLADLQKMVANVQQLWRNGADGGDGAAPRGGGGGRGAARGSAGRSGFADAYVTKTRTITTSTSPTKPEPAQSVTMDKMMKLQWKHTESMKKMAELTQQVTRV